MYKRILLIALIAGYLCLTIGDNSNMNYQESIIIENDGAEEDIALSNEKSGSNDQNIIELFADNLPSEESPDGTVNNIPSVSTNEVIFSADTPNQDEYVLIKEVWYEDVLVKEAWDEKFLVKK